MTAMDLASLRFRARRYRAVRRARHPLSVWQGACLGERVDLSAQSPPRDADRPVDLRCDLQRGV